MVGNSSRIASLIGWALILLVAGSCESLTEEDDPPRELLMPATSGTPPKVKDRQPPRDALDVALDTQVSATFNEEMDESTIGWTTFRLWKGQDQVQATVDYDAQKGKATLTPTQSLQARTVYRAELTDGIKDDKGDVFPGESWSFTTDN